MNDFEKDVRERKSLVPSARRRVCGSKSKHCSLPSDHLTPGQLKKLSGPVTSVRMNAPMPIAVFRELSSDLQREYLLGIRNRYHVSQRQIAKMMGTSQHTICRHLMRLDIPGDLPGVSPEERERMAREWSIFCGEGPAEEKPAEEAAETTENETSAADMPETPRGKTPASMSRTAVLYDLEHLADMMPVLQSLHPGRAATWKITVTWPEDI